MNRRRACEILEIPMSMNPILPELVKRQYRKKALKYHPDKNPGDETAHAVFQELNEAYRYLLDEVCESSNKWFEDEEGGGDGEGGDYASILLSFLKSAVKRDVFDKVQNRIFYMIVGKIAAKCETKAMELMERLDQDVLIKIHEILKMHQDVFHFSDHFLTLVEEVIRKKAADGERVILYTFIEDLLADNLYRLVVEDNTYIIPLWSHELVYDNGGKDLYVECVPILPDNMSIDQYNNLRINVSYKIADVWDKENIQIILGNRDFYFDPSCLKMTKNQMVVLANQGLAKVNSKDIYDISRRADIQLHIELEL